MKMQILKFISLTSLILLGLLGIFSLWGVIKWVEITAKITLTLGIIFVVTALIFELLRKDSKK